MLASAMDIEPFFDAATGTVAFVLADTVSGQAAVIDPVLDFDPKSGTLSSCRLPTNWTSMCAAKAGNYSGFWKPMPMRITSQRPSIFVITWVAK